jgi:predicted MPP superfamily phosphohydrolase
MNIDVMLAGHTHGGRLFPGNILTKIRFPMDKGRYQAGGTILLVSQGAGTFSPWMRIGTFNEVQLVTLVPGKEYALRYVRLSKEKRDENFL